jgi:phosphohistidine phosphatase SixA
MGPTLIHRLTRRPALFDALVAYRYALLLGCLLVLTLAGVSYTLRQPAAPVDLAEGNHLMTSGFYASWQRGDLVVLMRHVERCDHSTNPCLAQPDGITRKGNDVATALGTSIRALDLSSTDLYNSPLRRTEQTAQAVFHRTTAAQDWLINCRKTMLDDVLRHKLDHRNLMLVTHSECIAQLEKSLNVASPDSLDYGASLVVAVNPRDQSVRVLGIVDARSWGKVLAGRP